MTLAPWPARLFLIGFSAAIAVCGAFSVEAWPLTGWRLFSHERRQITTGWAATSVDARGRETPIPFGRFPAADQHFLSVMWTYGRLTPAKQEATCQAWGRLVRRDGGDTAGGLRLYTTVRDMRLHVGRRDPVVAVPTLRWSCADGHGARRVVAGMAAGQGAPGVATKVRR